MKDDILNTRYFSHYNQEYGKVYEENPKETAVLNLEKQIQKLKIEQEMIAAARGENLDHLEEL
eukprot:CAMPEP_0116870854 /NCGR_PEP_ID=MMETSP0463-20121206/944_1 /TAXON_ID=181622 /ORGANISM="Strombidinopsis sp, Strain SopsisLIS2011" /LENGTH=62 /DNA_ID=CAMNT_0004508171 /DNA_START=1042 /DNA_END=1230 /DNA_ORIENTATION=+